VNPFVAYEDFWRRGLDFRGRSSRAEYWWVVLINLVLALLFNLGERVSPAVGIVAIVYVLAALVPNIALGVRRLHDSDHRGYWLFLLLVPIVGPLALLFFQVLPSTAGPNRYGLPSKPRNALGS